MKAVRLLLSIAACATMACAGCDDGFTEARFIPPLMPSIKIVPDTVTIIPGVSITLSAIVTQDTTGALSGVTWSSADTMIARISAEGVLTARLPGVTTVKATSNFRTNKSASALIIVPAVISQCQLTISPPMPVIHVGTDIQMATPACAGELTWTVSDTTVAKVSVIGRVIGIKRGSAIVTASRPADSRFTVSALVTVVD